MINDAKSCPTAQNWSGALAGHAAAETPLQRQHSPNTTDNHRSAVRDAELPIFHSHKEASSLDKPPQQFWCLSTPCILLNQSYRRVSKDRSFFEAANSTLEGTEAMKSLGSWLWSWLWRLPHVLSAPRTSHASIFDTPRF